MVLNNCSYIKGFALLVFFTFVLSSCGSKKKIISVTGDLENKTQIELVSDVITSELKYNTISGKMDLEIIPGGSKKGLKINASVKIERDSIIQISLRYIIEGARITITPDSLYIIDRINRRYAVEDISKFGQSQGSYFNYYNLQALLTNSLFLPGKKEIDISEYDLFDVGKTSDTYMLKVADKAGITYNFAIDSSDRIASTLIFYPQKKATLQWSYNDFIKDGSYVYPTNVAAKIDIEKHRFDLNMNYSKLDINTKLNIDNSVPSKYDKVPLSDMISSLMKLK